MQTDSATSRLFVVWRSATTAAAVVALILGVTHLALRLPELRLLGAFSPAAMVSYDRLLGELSPLTDTYISRVLGIAPPAGQAPRRGAAPSVELRASSSATAPTVTAPATTPTELRHAFTNDRFADAVRPTSLPFVARTDSTSATREPGEPGSCAPLGGTAWYGYHVPAPVTLQADTFGTSYAAALAVFRGRSLSSLEQVGCSRSVTGNAAVSFRASAGETYWFQVTGPAGGGGLVFALTALGPTSRVSVAAADRESDGYHHDVAALSADGRYVAFTGVGRRLGSRPCGELGDQRALCNALFVRDRVTGTTELVLHSSPRRPNTQDEEARQLTTPDRFSYYHVAPKFSGNGRYITFQSDDPTLVPGDRNGHDDVFVLDRLTGAVERASVSSRGTEATTDRARTDRLRAGSFGSSMSHDGRYVVFTSAAEGLVPDDTNHQMDVFVRDRLRRVTERVSVSTGGGQLDEPSHASLLQAISGDGRYVVFASHAPSISPQRQPGPCAGHSCDHAAFIHDRVTRTTTPLARTPAGRPANGPSEEATISADGRVVAFTSLASDLVTGDTNEVEDVFWRDLRTGRTLRASVSSAGEQQRTPPVSPSERATLASIAGPGMSLSADGRYLVFSSSADNLVAGDENQSFDVFVHDSRTRSTVRLSVSESGEQGNGDSFNPFLSADGSSVLFGSLATNLVSGDSNRAYDLFVHDSPVPGRA